MESRLTSNLMMILDYRYALPVLIHVLGKEHRQGSADARQAFYQLK